MTVIEKAYAKINLFLDVLSTRPDGFHNIKSVMHSIDLFDTVTVTAEKNDVTDIILSTDSDLPRNSDNLAYKAAAKYLEEAGITATVSIDLIKRIPIAAGLGGGSSDAAAVLRSLNTVFGAFDREKLLSLALSIGSDVPFALIGGTAVCEGRGEPVSFARLKDDLYFVVAKSEERVSAAEAYRAFDEKYPKSDGTFLERQKHLNFPALTLISNSGKEEVPIYNAFEIVMENRLSHFLTLRETMMSLGAYAAAMTGSGPTVFAVFKKKSKAENAVGVLTSLGFYAASAQSSKAFSI